MAIALVGSRPVLLLDENVWRNSSENVWRSFRRESLGNQLEETFLDVTSHIVVGVHQISRTWSICGSETLRNPQQALRRFSPFCLQLSLTKFYKCVKNSTWAHTVT